MRSKQLCLELRSTMARVEPRCRESHVSDVGEGRELDKMGLEPTANIACLADLEERVIRAVRIPQDVQAGFVWCVQGCDTGTGAPLEAEPHLDPPVLPV